MSSSRAKRFSKKMLISISELWHPTQIIVVRVTLLLLLIAGLIPKLGNLILDNARFGNSIIIFVALLAFEILLAANRSAGDIQERSKIVQTRELADDLREAFGAKEVRLDFLCYSAETVFGLLVPIFFDMRKLRAERVYIRILIRDLGKPFIVPCDRERLEDETYRKNIVARNAKIVDEFYSNVARVRRESPDLEFIFEVRMQPFEPLQKGIIINRQRAFWCLYPIVSADRMLHGQTRAIWDYEGHSANLVEISSGGTALSQEIFRSITEWFDTVWEHFSRPLSEGDILTP